MYCAQREISPQKKKFYVATSQLVSLLENEQCTLYIGQKCKSQNTPKHLVPTLSKGLCIILAVSCVAYENLLLLLGNKDILVSEQNIEH